MSSESIEIIVDEPEQELNKSHNGKKIIHNHNKASKGSETDQELDKPHKAHKGKKISKVALSPNGKYVVTYNEENKSVVGWNIY